MEKKDLLHLFTNIGGFELVIIITFYVFSVTVGLEISFSL